MESILKLIQEKNDLLCLAEAEVEKLRRQIGALQEMANADDYSSFLEAKKKGPAGLNLLVNQTVVPTHSPSPVPSVELKATKSGRNKKGEVRKQILAFLSGGAERDIDTIKGHLDMFLANPLPRAPLRTALMYLKKDGQVESRKAGYFNVPQKGEDPGLAGSSDATESQQEL